MCTPSNTWFRGLTRLSIPNGISIGTIVFGRPLQATVRPMLRDRLSVTLVYCGQTVGWIKMPLDTEVGLGSGEIVLHGDPAPHTERGTAGPTFGPCLLWQNGRQFQQLLSFCWTAHDRISVYFFYNRPPFFCLKTAHSCGGYGPPSNTWFVGLS